MSVQRKPTDRNAIACTARDDKLGDGDFSMSRTLHFNSVSARRRRGNTAGRYLTRSKRCTRFPVSTSPVKILPCESIAIAWIQ